MSTSATRSTKERKRGIFSRIALFVRQVIAELKKVVTPTRSELLTYATVVLVFVLIVMGFIGLVDWGIFEAVDWVFGGSSSTGS